MPSTDHEQHKHDLHVRATTAEHQRKHELHEIELEGERFRAKHIELALIHQREDLRPYRMHNTIIFYIPNENAYVCRLPHYGIDEDDDDDDVTSHHIEAYGDTPAQACDNFDHKWIHQQEEEL